MLTTRQLIDAILSRCPADIDRLEWLARQLDGRQNVQRRIARLDGDERRFRQELSAQLKVIEDQKENVRSTCGHYDTTYHGDPAGGSDSHTSCNDCGKTWEGRGP